MAIWYTVFMKICFLGGTFAPAHNGHISLAKSAAAQLKPDKFIIMPCGIPPHKHEEAQAKDRMEMAKAAFADIPAVEISDYEIKREGKSFSYLTMQHLKQTYPDAELYFVMGADSLRDFDRWVNPQAIADLATLAVAVREDCDVISDVKKVKREFGARVVLLDAPEIDVSSTEIRVNCEFGLDNSALIPDSVAQYIKRRGLFSKYADAAKKLKGLQEQKRYLHTASVVKAGLDFARAAAVDEDKAFVACMLHDCGKNIPQEKWQYYGFDNVENLLPPILHCGLGVLVAQKEFGVTDQDVLNAIRYHTTGRPDMSELEKLVFVADKAEKNRKYDVCAYYKAGLTNLDKAFKMVLKDMYDIAVKKYGADKVDGLTVATMNFYHLL